MCSPLPGKVIKLSFSTSPKTLFPRFDLVPVYREAKLLVTLLNNILMTINHLKIGSRKDDFIDL